MTVTKNQTHTIEGSNTSTVTELEKHTLNGGRDVTVKGANDTLQVNTKKTVSVSETYTTTSTGEYKVNQSSSSFSMLGDVLKLTTPSSTLTLEQGKSILTGSSAKVTLEGSNVTIDGPSTVTVKGMASVKLECGANSVEVSPAGIKVTGTPFINLN